MKHINGLANSNGIDGAIGVRVVTGYNLQHARTESPQRFCFWMLLSLLSKTQSFTGDPPRSLGKTYVDSMEANSAPQEIDHVTFKREIRSGTLDDIFTVEFVRQNQLEVFIFDRLGPLIIKMTDLTTNHADFVLRRSIPWKE